MSTIRNLYRISIIAILSAITLVVLISAAISLFYEKEAIRYLKTYLDEHLRTQITVEDIHFRLLKGFPNATFELKNIVVLSGEQFSSADFKNINADTLLKAKRVAFQFDFVKFINSKYELKQIDIAQGYINILFDKKKRNNLTVWRKTEGSLQEEYNIELNSIHLIDMAVNIINQASNLKFSGNSDKLILKGSIDTDIAAIEAKGNLKIQHLTLTEKTLLSNADILLYVKSNYGNDQLQINESRLTLNKLPCSMAGIINTNKENHHLGLRIALTDFKLGDLLSLLPDDTKLIPNQYSVDGTASLVTTISGDFLSPDNLSINNTSFELSKGVIENNNNHSRIREIDLSGTASGSLVDSLFLHIDHFNSSIGEGQINVKIHSDSQDEKTASLYVNSTIDLSKASDFFDFKSFEYIEGLFISDFFAEYPLKQADSDTSFRYLSCLTNGNFILQNLEIGTAGGFKVHNMNGQMVLDEILLIDSLSLFIDNNKYLVQGKIDNIKEYLINNDMLFTNLLISSNKLDYSKYFSKTSSSSSSRQKVSLPSRVSINAEINAGKFVIGKFIADDLEVSMIANKDTAFIKNFIFKFIDGFISGNASISTTIPDGFSVICNAKPKNIDIRELFKACNNFAQHFIVEENVRGRLDGSISFSSSWDESFKFVSASTKAMADIEITNGELIRFEPMMKLSKYFDAEELMHVKFNTLKNQINIDNRQVIIPEMEIYSSAFNITASGVHSFDNEFNYHLKVLLSEVLFNRARNKRKEIDDFYVENKIDDQPAIPLIFTGNPDKNELRFDSKRAFSLSQQNTNNKNVESQEASNSSNFIIEWDDENVPAENSQNDTVENSSDDNFSIEWDDE